MPQPSPTSPVGTVRWAICLIAAIGFAFAIYELLMLPLIVRPALLDLAGVAPGTPEFESWVGRLFFVPAMIGGVCGLFGGYLTDLWGRRRVLTYSILLYAFSALAAGFATNLWWLLALRTTTFIGVCVEFVAAVAWLAELFPEPKTRERVLGYTQAFSSVGGMLVTVANLLALKYGDMLPAIYGNHEAWRYTLISGVIPALPLIVIRPFLPESPVWAAKKAAGTLRRPSVRELFSPQLKRTTIVTTLMFACSYGIAFGALQHTPRIVPGLPEVKAAVADMPVPRQKVYEQEVANNVNLFQELGGLTGRFLLAILAVRIVSRVKLLRVFLVPALAVVPLLYLYPAQNDLQMLKWGIFVAGLLTVGQFSFWGNYLPRAFPIHLRGTGESFAANIGGRVLGTSAALATTTLAPWLKQQFGYENPLAMAACFVALFACACGTILSFWLPEPAGDDLPE